MNAIPERIISISGLSVKTQIGVFDEEQVTPQKLSFDLRFASITQPEDLHEDLSLTVDYAAVSERVEQICKERPRRLIETLADEITKSLLSEFSLRWIELTIKKFILPNADYVTVTVRREKC
ncbi:MAG: dihydroneopterin aldolase [Chthoniobacterales bacterium]